MSLLRHYFCPSRRGCSSVVEHLLAKEDVASSSLVTRSSPESFRGWSAVGLAKAGVVFNFHFALQRLRLGRLELDFLESKVPPGCISLPKDEYENIASLHLLNFAGCCGHGTTASASSSASPGCFSVGECQRLARSGSGG